MASHINTSRNTERRTVTPTTNGNQMAKRQLTTNAFTVAYIGLFIFFLVYYARPNDWLPGMAAIPFAKISAIMAAVGLAAVLPSHLGRIAGMLKRSGEVKLLLLLFAWMCVTIPMATWRGGSFGVVIEEFSKVVLIIVMMAIVLNTPSRIRSLLGVSTIAVSVICLLALRLYLAGQTIRGRAQGPLSGVFGNANDLAMQAVMALPFAICFVSLTSNPMKKLFWTACAAALTVGTIVTLSRAGFIMLIVAVGTMFAGRGQRKGRAVIIPMLLAAGLLLAMVGSQFLGRFSAGDSVAAASAAQRKYLLLRSLGVTLHHPVFGVGPGNFPQESGVWRLTHNVYTQFSAETGLPGLILFVLLLRRTMKSLRAALESPAATREHIAIAVAVRSSLIVFMVGGFFSAVGYDFFVYYPVGCAAALYSMLADAPRPESEPDKGSVDVIGHRWKNGTLVQDSRIRSLVPKI